MPFKPQPPFYLVLDVHGTMPERRGGSLFEAECIEIALAVVRRDPPEIVDEFQSYIRPHRDPMLTRQCSFQTGVYQADVATAPDFALVMNDITQWLKRQGLTDNYLTIVDKRFEKDAYLQNQVKRFAWKTPEWALNPQRIQREFSYEYNVGYGDEGSYTIGSMLSIAKLHHVVKKGITAQDNAFNIALIVMYLIKVGHQFRGYDLPVNSAGSGGGAKGDGGFVSFADWKRELDRQQESAVVRHHGVERPIKDYLFDPRNDAKDPERDYDLASGSVGREKPLSSFLMDRDTVADNKFYKVYD